MPIRETVQISITGVVQGVGFRPFVHRLALRHGLAGWVRNDAGEVTILAEGTSEALKTFLEEIRTEAPPLARIQGLESQPAGTAVMTSAGTRQPALPEAWGPEGREPPKQDLFRILESQDQPDRRQPVSPDVALCPACQAELYDPGNRRYQYPFITCTDCGPRFSVIQAMPYDRERTSMGSFQQCPACLAEYREPGDRRYHSETNSCPTCGPRVWVEGGEAASRVEAGDAAGPLEAGEPAGSGEAGGPAGSLDSSVQAVDATGSLGAIQAAAEALKAGKILAVRGLGGFHLAVDATNESAVGRLRERKAREAKPLAVMVPSLAEARELGRVTEAEEAFFTSPERPIVLIRKLDDSPLAPSVAPGLDTVGVMTAYTPLHHLLLDRVGRPLVMTSGNQTDEPMATKNQEALERLGGIADLFLLHDREIVARCDDSVVRPTPRGPIFLRRARGYAPLPLELPLAAPKPLVAVGPHLKNTFTLVHGRTAFVSQHLGDLENLETLDHFQESLQAYQRLFRVTPEVAVRDLHPGYLSTRVARKLGLGEPLAVQHHHAHVAAVAAEHGVTEPVIGLAFDGTGYGDDGAVWGGEILVADLIGYERAGRLRYAPLPGGDLAARQPWRAALGYLSLEPDQEASFREAFRGIPEGEMQAVRQQVDRRLNAPLASSMGRLFDAAAAVLGLRRRSLYEGQAAMELEALAAGHVGPELPFPIREGDRGTFLLDPLPLLVALGEARAAGQPAPELAAGFHDAVGASAVAAARRVAEDRGIRKVALAGGVFQNARLLDQTARGLAAAGLEVLIPRKLGPNDGAISYGQAAVAAALFHGREGG